jgi:hypothetical protein
MSGVKRSYVQDGRKSVLRRMLSYIILGIVTSIPLVLYYIPATQHLLAVEIPLMQFQIGSADVDIYLDMYLFPTILSTILGAGGGFILWCYYYRTRCLEEQVPSASLIGD